MDLFGNTDKDLIKEYFELWRKRGYPNYNKQNYNPIKELNSIIEFEENTIFKNKKVCQTMHGLGFLWSYFPHWIDVKYGEQRTIRELWDDDELLMELIRKTYEYEKKHGNGTITINRLRQNTKVYLSKQSVSNFRPTAAKLIYNKLGNYGTVWDMSCGWGGRLLGFLASNCEKYIGTEPSIKTFEALNELINDLNIKKEVELHCCGSEEYTPTENTLDLCFTSPPYFDTEKYSEDLTQSYIKYNNKDKWVNGFLKKTFDNCFTGLKQGGLMVINISNTTKHKWIEEETINKAEEVGFTYIDLWELELSSISGAGRKYEPIFIFKK